MQFKASVLGHFGEGKNLLNGQTIKTKIVTEELENQLGAENVLKIDTHGGFKTLFKAPFQALKALKKSENVLIFPANNGLRVYAPLLNFFRRFFKGRKLHYVVIGGWLAKFISNRKGLTKILKRFDAIYVETNTMKNALESMGFQNVYVMPNCKKLTVLSEDELIYPEDKPFKLCTFSRVMREKGIEDAVNAVIKVNQNLGHTAYTLDIYGQVDTAQTEWFEELQKTFPDYITYGGLVPFDKSVEILKDYFALLFPTRFYTEGIPGTIIDAYAAGVPVISSRWESFGDIVIDGVTGVGYEFGACDALYDVLLHIQKDSNEFNRMKEHALRRAEMFLPEMAIEALVQKID